MTLLTVLKSTKCDGNKDDNKCAKALKTYLEQKDKKHQKVMDKRRKHHLEHHHHKKDKKHHKRNNFKDKPHKHTNINVYNVIGDKIKEVQHEKPTPSPAPTGQGVHQDVPYSNLMNQQKMFESQFRKLEEQKSRFQALYNRHTGDTMNDGKQTQTDHTGDIPRKSGPKKGSKNKPKKEKTTTESGVGTDARYDSEDVSFEREYDSETNERDKVSFRGGGAGLRGHRQKNRDSANFGDGFGSGDGV